MSFTTFTPLFWLLLLLLAGWAYRRSLVDRPTGLKIASFALRLLGLVLLALALCQPFREEPADEAHVVFALDVSQSVDLTAAKDALKQIEDGIKNLRSGDTHSVFALGNGLRSKTPPDFVKMLESWTGGVADDAGAHFQRMLDADPEVGGVVLAGIDLLHHPRDAHEIDARAKFVGTDHRRSGQNQDRQRMVGFDDVVRDRPAAADMAEAEGVVTIEQHTL